MARHTNKNHKFTQCSVLESQKVIETIERYAEEEGRYLRKGAYYLAPLYAPITNSIRKRYQMKHMEGILSTIITEPAV